MTDKEIREHKKEWYQEKFNKFVLDDLTQFDKFRDTVVIWLFLYGVGILIILAGVLFILFRTPQ